MNTACPTDDRLKQLICEAFDELPGADTLRLGQIGRKLGQQAPCHTPRRTNMRQWLFWVLFGASMTAAAWWGGQHWYSTYNTPAVTPTEIRIPETTMSPASQSPMARDSLLTKPDAANTRPSPVIDRREQY